MPWENNDDDDMWDDNSDDVVVTETKTKTTGTAANNDSDSDSLWDDSDDDKAAKPKAEETAKKETNKTEEKKKPAAEPKKKWTKGENWESESSEEEYVDDGPKRSTKKSKLKRERIKALDRPKQAAKKVKKKGDDSDSDSSSEDGDGVKINRFEANEKENKLAGFGDEGYVARKKAKKRGPIIPTKVGDLYKINNEMSRKDQEKELKRLARDVSGFILDLAMPAVDQNKKKVAPRLRGWQVKDFICTFINRCSLPLDANELSAVRIQAESEIKNLAARERRERKDARNKKPVKKKRPRIVHIEQHETTYVDGQFDEREFEAFI